MESHLLVKGKPMSAKESVMKILKRLPETASLDDIMEELYVRMQIEEGLRQLDAGKGLPQESVEQRDQGHRRPGRHLRPPVAPIASLCGVLGGEGIRDRALVAAATPFREH